MASSSSVRPTVEVEAWKLDAQKIKNPAQTVGIKPFLTNYFPADLETTGKPKEGSKRKLLEKYAEYLQTIIKATALDENAKFSGSIKGLFQSFDDALSSNQFRPAHEWLEAVFQLIEGQAPEKDPVTLEIDGHQWKHYVGGESGAAQFSLSWENAHRLMICAVRKLNLKSGDAPKSYLLVTVTDLKDVGTGGNQAPGKTNLVKLEVACSTKDHVEFHGYPIGSQQYSQARSKGYPEVNVTSAEFLAIGLEPPNNDKRMKK